VTSTRKKTWTGAATLKRYLVAIDTLEPFPGNPRRGDLDAIRASLRRFGQVRPILVDGSRIVAGHHLVRAAEAEGWTHVAAIANEFGSEDEARAYLLADNRTAELGSIDEEALNAQLQALRGELDGTGYTERFASALDRKLEALREAAAVAGIHPDLDTAPALPETPESRPGEVYELGPHRLVCGDCRDPEILNALMVEKGSLVFTDPPYGVAYQEGTPDDLKARRRRKDLATMTVANDALGDEGTRLLVAQALVALRARVAPGTPFYVCAPSGVSELAFRLALADASLELRQVLVWAKNVFVFGRQDYHWRHESILYGWFPGAAHPWFGGRNQDTVWEVARPKQSKEHPTMKPLELIGRALRNSSTAGEVVVDPFAGSGSTLIAAEILGRRCFAVELDPRYCDVIRRRYDDFQRLPESARTIPEETGRLVLTGSADQLATLRSRDLEILRKELGVEDDSEALLLAASRYARELNQA
jgi:site-specific DNA-methyltransferase (adenine-specific)